MLSTYNGEKYLKELIESLLNQSGVDINIAIRDDGSSDETLEYLKGLEDYRISAYGGKNIGSTRSFFDLLKKAPDTYDFYAYCDQDDVWKDEKLSVAVMKLKSLDSNFPALYYSGQIITDKNLNVLYSHKLDTDRSEKACFIFNQMAGCTAVFNKALLNKLKLYIPQKVARHDAWTYKLCVALGGNIVVDRNGYILYRQHSGNEVGLRNGIKGKLARSYNYVFKYNASSYAEDILQGYGEELAGEWKEFLNTVCESKRSFAAKISLLGNKDIRYHKLGLRFLFIAKVLLGKI